MHQHDVRVVLERVPARLLICLVPMSLSCEEAVQIAQESVALLANVAVEDITAEMLDGGASNVIARVRGPGVDVLVRRDGPAANILVDRDCEVHYLTVLGELGVGPRVHAHRDDVLVYDFVPGRPLPDVDELRTEERQQAVATRMVKYHSLKDARLFEPTGGPTQSDVWARMDVMLEALAHIEPVGTDGALLAVARNERRWLGERLSGDTEGKFASPIVFGHCDVNGGNVILRPNETVVFIDHEYARPCERGYDIGEHLNEYMDIPYDNRHVDEVERRRFCKFYLEAAGASTSDAAVDALVRESHLYGAVGHLFFGIWSLVRQFTGDDKVMDYRGYAWRRIAEYMSAKSFWEDDD